MQGNGRGPGDSWVTPFPEEPCAALHQHSGSEAGTDVQVAGDGPHTGLRPARGSGGRRRARRATVQETKPGLQLRASTPHLRLQHLQGGPAWLARPTRASLPGPQTSRRSGSRIFEAGQVEVPAGPQALAPRAACQPLGAGRPPWTRAGWWPAVSTACHVGTTCLGILNREGPAEFPPDEVFVQEMNTQEAGALLCSTLNPSHLHPCGRQGGPSPHASGSPGGPSAAATPLPPLRGRPDPPYLHPQAAADQRARAEVTAWDVPRPA